MKPAPAASAPRPATGWAIVLTLSALAAVLIFRWDIATREADRVEALQLETERSATQVLSSIYSGRVMEGIGLLGLIDTRLKQEAMGATEANPGEVRNLLSNVGRAIGAQCLFVVAEDGTIRSFWSLDGESATGLDVRQKPYFQMALAGKRSVYASVDLAHVERRKLYYAAPIYSEVAISTVGSGALVACTGAEPVDQLLATKADDALLVSPQGVIYASKQPKWLGALVAEPSQQQLADIRALRQFGTFFNASTPLAMSLKSPDSIQTLNGLRYAVASSTLSWNDPTGGWQLVLLENLSGSVPNQPALTQAMVAATLVLILGWMGLHIRNGRQKQNEAHRQLTHYAQRQEADARYRAELAAASLRLQRCDKLSELAQVFLSESRQLLGAVQGTLYVSPMDPGTHELTLAGHSACAEAPPGQLKLGEGLLGQCAQERRTQVVAAPSGGHWTLRSGLGEAPPAALLLAPLVMQDQLIGALELGLLHLPDEDTLPRLDELVFILANTLAVLRRHQQAPTTVHPGSTEVTP